MLTIMRLDGKAALVQEAGLRHKWNKVITSANDFFESLVLQVDFVGDVCLYDILSVIPEGKSRKFISRYCWRKSLNPLIEECRPDAAIGPHTVDDETFTHLEIQQVTTIEHERKKRSKSLELAGLLGLPETWTAENKIESYWGIGAVKQTDDSNDQIPYAISYGAHKVFKNLPVRFAPSRLGQIKSDNTYEEIFTFDHRPTLLALYFCIVSELL